MPCWDFASVLLQLESHLSSFQRICVLTHLTHPLDFYQLPCLYLTHRWPLGLLVPYPTRVGPAAPAPRERPSRPFHVHVRLPPTNPFSAALGIRQTAAPSLSQSVSRLPS